MQAKSIPKFGIVILMNNEQRTPNIKLQRKDFNILTGCAKKDYK